MKTVIYRMDCLTNLHVGSGEVNYNIIDNEVQKDPVTKLPNINSSSIKGALRDYFSNSENINRKNAVDEIFGKDNAGRVKIFSANMLARPLRISKGNGYFLKVTSKEIINQFHDFLSNFSIDTLKLDKEIKENIVYTTAKNSNIEVEGLKVTTIDEQKLVELFGCDIGIISDNNFKQFDLPVLARNRLENGISKNLWFEEVVPSNSVFYFVALIPDDLYDLFNLDGEIVQFGANASIGYGYCKIVEVMKHE